MSKNKIKSYTYEVIKEIADYLCSCTEIKPKVGIICGSGLSSMTDDLTNSKAIDYKTIPKFPVSTVEGHAGKMVFGELNGVPVMAMQGRFHHYEGYPLSTCSMPVRVMKLVGINHLIATNAAGGLNPKFKVGDIMIIKDHIQFMGFAGNSPLRGPNEPRFGPRFPPMTKAYNPHIIDIAKKCAKDMEIEKDFHVGVYACLGGPTYESTAECKMLHTCGVDAVGMSTVHEVVTARHCDMTVFAFSLITNKNALNYEAKEIANHEEVVSVGKAKQKVCAELVCRILGKLAKELKDKKC